MASIEDQISGHTIDKVTKAKVQLENFYSNLISQNKEREQRFVCQKYTTRFPSRNLSNFEKL